MHNAKFNESYATFNPIWPSNFTAHIAHDLPQLRNRNDLLIPPARTSLQPQDFPTPPFPLHGTQDQDTKDLWEKTCSTRKSPTPTSPSSNPPLPLMQQIEFFSRQFKSVYSCYKRLF